MCRAFVLANRKHHQVAIFPNTLWHGVAPSFALDEEGQGVRRSVTLRYGQMWSRPYLLRPIFLLILSPFRSTDFIWRSRYDYQVCPPDVLQRMTPRRRRLMGDMGPDALQNGENQATDYFKPVDQIETMMEGYEFECPHA